ncbi:uncharacterized protein FIBRA_00443 [Fibroporia radiculosa]|uniref:ARM repeat-containing protein n=1 Tax=Fibroporia radiculosa TaxID=599839 RepID=J4I7Y0_9APHY|nr:uncharacterized protein FIBRA_00443 [Fibroporia radiculosa]CCL98446.1 predicted protein [Fibroporia radiculosa]
MPADSSFQSVASSPSRSSSPKPDCTSSPVSDAPPSPLSDHPSVYSPYVDLPSPPSNNTSYAPHVVGLGIISPRPFLGPLAPIVRAPVSPPHQPLPSTIHRSDPFGDLVYHTPLDDTLPLTAYALESDPPSHGLPYVSPTPAISSEDPFATMLPPSVTSSSSLRIAIPPPNASASTSTPSPPLLPPVTGDVHLTHSQVPVLRPSIHPPTSISPSASSAEAAAYFGPNDTPYSLGADLPMASPEINIDFTDIDSDGLSALEKIYLFSRSRAGFHRVFIVHALPRYLGADEADAGIYVSREQIDRITPAEAVEYVLPLLNGLALDEDEAVKEALAAELVPIIWWFITHCRLVDDELPFEGTASDLLLENASASENDDTTISVQSFTPILGTLLLSQNTLVGGPSRQAVAHILRRILRASEREEGRTAVPPAEGEEPEPQYEMGLLGPHERALFEREIVQQVVIGMGRLDVQETDESPLSTISTPRSSGGGHHEHHIDHHRSNSLEPLSPPPVPATAPDSSTAGSTPLAAPRGMVDSYFPAMPSGHTRPSPPSGSPLRIPYAEAHSPPAFALGQPPISPPAYTNQPVASPSNVANSPAQSAPSPTSSAFSAAMATRSDAGQSPREVGPTPSSSSSSFTSTPSLTSSTSSSSASLESPGPLHPPGAATLPAALVLASSAAGPSNGIAADPDPGANTESDAVMMDSRAGTVVGSPRRRSPDLRLDLSGTNGQAIMNAPFVYNAHEGPEGAGDSVSAWLSTGLPESDASLENFPDLFPVSEDSGEDEDDIGEEAAMGRLSSMSLMAAVTASGFMANDALPFLGALRDEIKSAFVTEVERVGRDPVYWVRREAAFALGALAKVVPDELVVSSLLPLFEALYRDPTWHVRQSVLFTLPAILARLSPSRRRSLALDVMLPLSLDESPTVRAAALEALGEVMHTFADDEGGPPKEILNLFLGIREAGASPIRADARKRPSTITTLVPQIDPVPEPLSEFDIYDDPARPLVCAFNFPAVALTLGRDRWQELRTLYRTLTKDPSFKVRRTLAASLGEMAKIIGPDHSRVDLLDVWWASIRSEETDTRLKAVECAAVFVSALGEADRTDVVRGLHQEFLSGKLKGWRERQEVIKSLPSFLDVSNVEMEVLEALLLEALADRVSAIRETAVIVSPSFVAALKCSPELVRFRMEIRRLAFSDSYRQRSTFVNCEHALLLSHSREFVLLDDNYWDIFSVLVSDPVVDVRIRVARLLVAIYGDQTSDESMIARVCMLAERLEQDTSQDVRAFAQFIKNRNIVQPPAGFEATKTTVIFSRPPPS